MRGGLRSFLGVAMLAGAALAWAAGAAELTGTEFVGPESCKACHPDAYAAWRLSKHARAIGHPVVASAEPGERWLYCYPDDGFAEY